MNSRGPDGPRYNISPWLIFSFFIFVATPTAAGIFYFSVIQSQTFTSMTKLATRDRDESSFSFGSELSSVVSQMGGVNLGSAEKDAYAVKEYVTSRAIIEDLGGSEAVESLFDSKDADIFSRYKGGGDVEEAWKYWNEHVSAFVDSGSGLVRVQVSAYSPGAAHDLLAKIVSEAEDLLNSASVRAREYNVKAAQLDFERSISELGAAQARLLDFQIRTGTVDPAQYALEMSEIIGKLRLRRAELQAAVDASYLSGSAQNLRTSERLAQIEAVDKQISYFQSKMTGDGDSEGISLASMLREYEPLRLEVEFRDKMYELDLAALEKARAEADRQQKYLMTVVAPVLSDSPSGAPAAVRSLLLFAMLSICWGIGALFVSALNDR